MSFLLEHHENMLALSTIFILKKIYHQLCTMTNSHLDMQGLKTIIPMQPKQLFQKAENAPQLVPLLFFKLENNNHHSMTTRLSQIECQNNFFCLYVRYGQQQTDNKTQFMSLCISKSTP